MAGAEARFDVVIAGGGPAGAAAGIALAGAGLRVLIADRRPTNGGQDRAPFGESLPPSARSLLRDLGGLGELLADGHRPSPGTLAFWGSDIGTANDFLFQVHGLGWQLDRVRFDAGLRRRARAAGAELVESASLHLDANDGGQSPFRCLLRSQDGTTRRLSAERLIDASGRPALLARHLGAERIVHDRLLAFRVFLRSPSGTDRDGRTWVEATEDGWWYSVLLPAGERLIVFLGDADLLDRRTLLAGEALWRRLASAPHLHALCRQHGYRPMGRVHGSPAGSVALDRAAGPNWLAVGDAALAFDPLSSKGIANALYTGLSAARTVRADLAGDHQAGARYAAHLNQIHQVYRQQLSAFYALERRWPEAPFWQRRRQPAAPAARAERSGRPGDDRVDGAPLSTVSGSA